MMRVSHLASCCRLQRLLCCHYASDVTSPQVAIIGSGPAGYYTAQQIFKGNPSAYVDVYERLPVPFGLVRFGVAPDHPEVKNVINTFTQTASNPRCSFLGNVTVGRDISIQDLQKAYTAVVMAYGAESDKTLGIPGETLRGVYSARSFVGWYNGVPENRELAPNLDTDTAVVLGQGNVAIDVARMLLTPVDELRNTDTTDYALEALSGSRVRRVYLVGRRGPLQAAFTIAELREMLRLKNCIPIFSHADFEGLSKYIAEIPRSRKRLTELMIKTALEPPGESDGKRWQQAESEWVLKFLRSPQEILPTADGSAVSGVRLTVTRLEGPVGPDQKAVATSETEDLPCGLVFRSIGYRSEPLERDLPFDDHKAVIPNSAGRVPQQPGLYCSGWVKRGPVGVIVSTMNDAFETGKSVVDDLNNGSLKVTLGHTGKTGILEILKSKGVQPVSFEEWKKIDSHETRLGESRGKPREKLVNVQEMLKIAKQ